MKHAACLFVDVVMVCPIQVTSVTACCTLPCARGGHKANLILPNNCVLVVSLILAGMDLPSGTSLESVTTVMMLQFKSRM